MAYSARFKAESKPWKVQLFVNKVEANKWLDRLEQIAYNQGREVEFSETVQGDLFTEEELEGAWFWARFSNKETKTAAEAM